MTKSNMPDFQASTKALAQKFRTFYEQYYLVRDWLNFSEGQIRVIDRIKPLIDRLEQPEFPVAFLGSFSAGKSTIINAFLGRDLLPENTKVSTAIPTIIRSGANDGAVVHFLNRDERIELFNLWTKEISVKLKIDLPILSHADVPKVLVAEINKMVQNLGDCEQNIGKELSDLKKLANKWEEHAYPKNIQLSELSIYVTEKFPESFLINRVEAVVTGIEIPQGMVLVDLPGLNVANPIHQNITKNYVEKEAKAFIVCLKPDHLMEGDEIRLLDEINQKSPQILKRAFWLINKWEQQDDTQRQQIRANFAEIVQSHGFEISEDRRFEVSALNYLLVKAIANRSIDNSSQLKDRVTNLEKLGIKVSNIKQDSVEQIIGEHQVLKNYSLFEKSLKQYLAGPALIEFIGGAQQELSKLLSILLPELERLANYYDDSESSEEDLQIGLIVKNLEAIKGVLNTHIEALLEEVRINNFTAEPCWNNVTLQDIQSRLSPEVRNQRLESIFSAMATGADVDVFFSSLPGEMNRRLGISKLLREKLREQVGDNYILAMIDSFFLRLDAEVQLPEDFLQELRQLLGTAIVYSRIDGLADALFYEYGRTIDQIGMKELSEIKPDENTGLKPSFISVALEIYEKGLQTFLLELAPRVNQVARRAAKNFVEINFLEIGPLFEKHIPAFSASIRKNISFDETLKLEQLKQTTIKEALNVLNELK